jgi:hypothetical protein
MAKPSSNMRVSTTERDRRLTLAINYFNKHKDVPIRRIAKKYKVDHKTLSNRIQGKQQSIGLSGGQNKLLTAVEVDAVVLYIHNQAYVGFPCTWQMIEGAVTCIRAQNNLPPPSQSWVKKFMSNSGPILQAGIHKIKWKPMDAKRRAAQDIQVVVQWFKGLEEVKVLHDIKAGNMWNFDETGVRNACPSAIWVWVPIDIKEVSLSSYLQ